MPRQGKIVWACCCWIGLSNLQNAVFHDRALAWTGKGQVADRSPL